MGRRSSQALRRRCPSPCTAAKFAISVIGLPLSTVQAGVACRNLTAGIHHQHLLAKRANRRHDVLHQNDADAFAGQTPHHRNAFDEFGGIETGQPFIEQEDTRIGRPGPRKFCALLIDIGELRAGPAPY